MAIPVNCELSPAGDIHGDETISTATARKGHQSTNNPLPAPVAVAPIPDAWTSTQGQSHHIIALSQLGPYFQRGSDQAPNAVDPMRLSRLEQLVAATGGEVTGLLKMEMIPYGKDKEMAKEIKASIRDWLVQNTIRADPDVREAISSATARRKREADEAAEAASSAPKDIE